MTRGSAAETVQTASAGDSSPEIHAAALAAAAPARGLTWLDVGCGNGAVLRAIRRHHAPQALTGVDIIDWLDPDLRADVAMHVGPAEDTLQSAPAADRVLLVETMEHLESPWTVLRAAAARVAPGGRIVVSTPNVATFRHRVELAVRGELTAFRPDNAPHLGPILPHVVERILGEEGFSGIKRSYAGRDLVPKTGKLWPARVQRLAPRLSSVTVIVSARRERR
jgi:precorrin-6B methylase 2